jgi:rfaE bifunctional protein nucleotidyltransferase chain/domain
MLLDRHRAKIVHPDQLAALLGPRPRARTVVMCHGVFDVVHPGHLRHLLYAKSKADVLVCGVTADAHITKGPYRPHVPQDLRAANLAMLDIVDYVVVVDATKPTELLGTLQPDFFAKGFEYSRGARPAGPIAEVAAVEAYGGEVLFTPGDVVYSSSALIEAAAPDLRWDKLRLVMRRAEVSFDDLRLTLAAMGNCAVHVVGDAIVDALLHCEVVGANAKTPTISVRRDRREDFVGGAGIVAKHARAAGAAVKFTTVLGGDQHGLMVLDDLAAAGVEVDHVVDRARPTTVKEAVVAGGYRLLKIDTVDNRPVSDAVLERLRASVAETRGGAVVFSDFRHGIFNARTIPGLIVALLVSGATLRVADSQVASRWGNILDFPEFDLVVPNEREARFALGDQDSGVRPLAHRLHAAARCRWLLMKMGARGVLACAGRDAAGEDQSFVLDSFARAVVDPVGAGDAFLAYATLALLVRPCLATAAVLGSLAAGAECQYDGNVPVALERVLAKIDEAERETT